MTDDKNKTNELPDVQKTKPAFEVAIDRVGISGYKKPLVVLRDDGTTPVHTVGAFNAFVYLPADQKGTHMSRLVLVLEQESSLSEPKQLTVQYLILLNKKLAASLGAECSHVSVDFDYFLKKTAPVTGHVGTQVVQCRFSSTLDDRENAVAGEMGRGTCIEVTVLATSLCPCSKEISSAGAHNQRSRITIRVHNQFAYIEELVACAESAASCPIFPALKRPDEKWVTEKAYESPRFVEDMVRAIYKDMRERGFRHFEAEVHNEESIHQHDASAYITGK